MATDLDTARHQYEMYRYCYDNGHEKWVQLASRCFKFWKGEQWEELVRARLNVEGRPALTFNVIESLVRAMKGIHKALRNDVRYMPVGNADMDTAKVMDMVWMHIQNQNQMDFLESEVYEKGLIMGRAYYDIRVSRDESLQGHVRVRVPRSQDVILDPAVEGYDPADDWPQVYKRRWVSNKDIEWFFGKEKANAVKHAQVPDCFNYEDQLMAQQMGQMPYYHMEPLSDDKTVRAHLMLDRQHYVYKMKEVFIDVETGDISEIPETWDDNRISNVLETVEGLSTMKRNMRTVRWDITCDGEVMHSEDSPYKHFTIVPFFPSFVDGITMGAVESLLDPQELFNKITSQELHIINTTANSGWKVKTGSLKNMSPKELEQNGSKSGFVAELDDIQNMEKIQPNSTPQGHDRLSFKADQIMRNLAGSSNSGRGFARDDASGEKVMQDQAAQEINFAGWLSNLHRTKQLVASRVQDCVQSHYTETRVIQINKGSAFAPKMDEVTINQPTAEGGYLNDVTQGRYTTVLVPAPSRTNMSTDDFKLMVMMRQELGIAIPDTLMVELSPAGNKAQIIQSLGGPDSAERQKAKEEAENRQAEATIALEEAKGQKEKTAAALNQARAEKFVVEAAADPDAAYERVETTRLENENLQHDDKMALEYARLDQERKKETRELAVKLTEIDADREAVDKNNEVKKATAAKPAAKPKAKAKK